MNIEYQKRIGASLTYIQNNLQEEITIKTLARVSCLSEFHFHRIFRALTGESAYEHISRVRLEKAAKILRVNKEIKLTNLAFECGFSSYENFSRQFKKRFKQSASSFKRTQNLQKSRIYQAKENDTFYVAFEKARKLKMPSYQVKIRNLPASKIAFVQGKFGADGTELVNAYLRLMDWATTNHFFDSSTVRFAQILDDFEITEAKHFRYNFSITVPEHARASGDVQITYFEPAKYAIVHCTGDLERIAQAWDYLYKKWLPGSEYLPANRPALEIFIKGPEQIGWDTFDIECCIPIIK